MSKITIFLLMLIFLVPGVHSSYYADVDIYVSNDGIVSIDGETNHPLLQVESSSDLTSKNGRFWLLNITVNDSFSDFIYHLHLPAGSVVNYLKTPTLARIETSHDELGIIGTGHERKFVVVVQYTISSGRGLVQYVSALIGLAVFIAGILLVIFVRKKKKKPLYNSDSLTERQKQIVKLVEKSRKPITQTDIERATRFPKSSLSRNIGSLVRKGILKKEEKGMSNLIFLSNK